MIPVEVGFRAFDLHELLCHFVAEHLGYYADEGIRPQLRDLTFIDPVPATVFQVACGSVLLDRFRGYRNQVVLVAARGPMFHLLARSEIRIPQALRGLSIASFPRGSPPDLFLRIFVRLTGMDPNADLTIMAIRDDAARLGLFWSGEVDAALVSSATPFSSRGDGALLIANLAEELSIPTSGLAVHEEYLGASSELVEAMVRIHRRSLAAIQTDTQAVVSILNETFRITDRDRDATLSDIRATFSADGLVHQDEAERAIALVGSEIPEGGLFRWNELYGAVAR